MKSHYEEKLINNNCERSITIYLMFFSYKSIITTETFFMKKERCEWHCVSRHTMFLPLIWSFSQNFPFQVYTLFLHLSVKHPISSQKRWNNWTYIFSNNWNVLLGTCIGQSLHKHTLHLMQKLLQWRWLTFSLWIICLCIINLENLKLAKQIASLRFLTCDCSNFLQGMFSIFITIHCTFL